jgi:hypothetical protein
LQNKKRKIKIMNEQQKRALDKFIKLFDRLVKDYKETKYNLLGETSIEDFDRVKTRLNDEINNIHNIKSELIKMLV